MANAVTATECEGAMEGCPDGFGSLAQDAGSDDDVVVMTEDFDDLMDEDAVVLPDANHNPVSHVATCLQPYAVGLP